MNHLRRLTYYRKLIYQQLPYRSDAVFNLLDALTTSGRQCQSVVELSESTYFQRKYSSITDAITCGLDQAPWNELKKLTFKSAKEHRDQVQYHRFVLDCTSNARPYANKLEDRYITHIPNPSPGNKPIGVGHQYSCLAYLPQGTSKQRNHWVVPVDMQCVNSTEKGHESGIHQFMEIHKTLGLNNELTLLIADSSYSSEKCRKLVSDNDGLLFLVRLRGNRNVYKRLDPQLTRASSKGGRKKRYGKCMNLKDADTHLMPNENDTFEITTKKGKDLTVNICCWNDMVVRGSRTFKAYNAPFRLIRCTMHDKTGKDIFTRPIWLALQGKKQDQIKLQSAVLDYLDRYDIEHFFRFSKQNLLLDKYQTSETSHEQSWWRFVCLVYWQLFMMRKSEDLLPRDWEMYLPEYKNVKQGTLTPSQAQRVSSRILKLIGTPAKVPVARGNPLGRKSGDIQVKRQNHAVIFKSRDKRRKRITNKTRLRKTDPKLKIPKNEKALIDYIIKVIENEKIPLDNLVQRLSRTI